MKDISTIVYKLLETEMEISQDKGPFSLFALFLREGESTWDILVSSVWIDKDKYGSMRYISSKIQNKLTKEELIYVSGIEIIDNNNPDLEAIYRTVNVEHSTTEIENRIFFGFWIKHAYIITSRKMILA